MPLLLAVAFSSDPAPVVTYHLGWNLAVLACAAGFFLPIFTGVIYLKALWRLRRELQPMRQAWRLIFSIMVCAAVSTASAITFNLLVAPRIGVF